MGIDFERLPDKNTHYKKNLSPDIPNSEKATFPGETLFTNIILPPSNPRTDPLIRDDSHPYISSILGEEFANAKQIREAEAAYWRNL